MNNKILSIASDANHLDDEFSAINEMAENNRERAELISDLAFRALVQNYNLKFDPNFRLKPHLFIPETDGELYRLPNYPQERLNRLTPNYRNGELIGGGMRTNPTIGAHEYITNDKVPFIKVEQQHMLVSPLERNGIFLSTMTSCTSLIGKSKMDLLFAHVGLSERGNIKNVLQFFNERDVESSSIVAFSMAPMAGKEQPIGLENNPWHSTVTPDDLLDAGISQDRIIIGQSSYVSEREEYPSHNVTTGYDGVMQVTAGSDFVTTRTFGYTYDNNRFSSLKFTGDTNYIEL